MRVIVTGSRNWTNHHTIYNALHEQDTPDDSKPTLVYGGAPGADAIAAWAATLWGWTLELHRADWEHEGKAAGPNRNQRMVDSGADICLAFPLGESRGTRDCIRRAEAAGIPVLNYGDAS